MSTETTTLRAVLRDELSRPIRRLRGEVDSTNKSMQRLARTNVDTPLGRAARGVGVLGLALEKADPKLRRMSEWLTNGLVRGAKVAAVGLGALGVAASVFAIRAASDFQQTRIALDGFLGSAAAGKAMFADLQKLNLQTPFRLQDVSGGARQLLGFGFSGEQVQPILKAATDTAAGLAAGNDGLQRILLNLGQIRSQGKVTGRDLRDLAILGVPSYELAATAIGGTADQVRAMGDDVHATSDQFINAFISMQGPMQRFTGMAEQQMNSLQGQWSNLQDMLSMKLADESSPLVKQLTIMLPKLTTALGSLIDVAGPPLFSFISILANGLIAVLPLAQPILVAVASGLGLIARAAAPLLPVLQPVANELGDAVLQFFVALVPLLPDLVSAFVALVEVLPVAVQLLGDMLPLAKPLLELVTGLLGFGPVRTVAATALIVLAGYRILGPLAQMGFEFAASLFRIALGQEAVNAANAAGGAPTGATSALAGVGERGAANVGMFASLGKGLLVGGATKFGSDAALKAGGLKNGTFRSTLSTDLGLITGGAAAGGLPGAVLGTVGAIGNTFGALMHARSSNGVTDADRERARAQTAANNADFASRYPSVAQRWGLQSTTTIGQIVIQNPSSTADVTAGVTSAIKANDLDKYERGVSP